MPRKEYKYHYIYKTINQINGKYYLGMHSTNCLEDDYIGSGMRLWYSIKKYGRENFKKEILEFCLDRKSLDNRETEIITKEIVHDPLCMNLKTGGQKSPGTLGKTYSEESRKRMSEWKRPKELGEKISKKLSGKKLSTDHCKAISEGKVGTHYTEDHRKNIGNWERSEEYRNKISEKLKGRVLSADTREKMSKSSTGKHKSEEHRKALSDAQKGRKKKQMQQS